MRYVKVYEDGYWCYNTPELSDGDEIQKLYDELKSYIITERPNAIEICTNTEIKNEVWWQIIQRIDVDNMITLLGYDSPDSWDLFDEYDFRVIIRTDKIFYSDMLDYEKNFEFYKDYIPLKQNQLNLTISSILSRLNI